MGIFRTKSDEWNNDGRLWLDPKLTIARGSALFLAICALLGCIAILVEPGAFGAKLGGCVGVMAGWLIAVLFIVVLEAMARDL